MSSDLQPLSAHSPSLQSEYLNRYLGNDELTEYIRLAVRALKKWCPYFDAIAFTGYSGTLIAPPVARVLKKTLIMVRKSTKDCHSDNLVEGDYQARAYIIVDDLVSSGETQRKIRKQVKTFAPDAKCLGVLPVNYLCGPTITKRVRKHGKYPLCFEKNGNDMYGDDE